jgi:hypothetical protein
VKLCFTLDTGVLCKIASDLRRNEGSTNIPLPGWGCERSDETDL